ncbi:unnamed protein product [Moneuplotes crassus]|uniref:Uncharacterized protein n=1 Tax=Euplotes crassus TaxID=5936 RepID=A0AAD1Y950_EUPCR|nr:unnamed protein product [Moneuplotes crassus]
MEVKKKEINNSEKKIMLKGRKKKKGSSSERDVNTTSSSERKSIVTSVTLDGAFDYVKGNGTAPLFFGIFFAVSCGLNALSLYQIPFMTKMPDFECRNSSSANWEACTVETVCANTQEGFETRYDWSSETTIDNWITRLGLECVDSSKIGIIGSLFFLGFVLGAGFLLRLADIKGRKPILMASLIVSLFFGVGYLFVQNIYHIYILTFINGIVGSVRISCSYMYEMEMIPESMKKNINLLSGTMDSLCVIFIAFFYYCTRYGNGILQIYIVFTVIVLVIMTQIPETPRFLYSTKQWDRLHKCFDLFAKMNRGNALTVKFDQEDHEVEDENGKIRPPLCEDRRRVINLIAMVFNWCVCSFSFYVLGFFVKYFKGNMYTNACIMGIADVLANVTLRAAQQCLSTKKGFVISFSWVFLFTIIYFFIQDEVSLVPIIVLCMRFGVTFAFSSSYFGNQEYFESHYLSTVFGICNVFARSSTIFAPIVVEMIPQPIVLITIFTLASAITSTVLKRQTEGSFQTSGKKGNIPFVEGSAVEGRDVDSGLEQREVEGIDEVRKEVFLLEDDDEEDQSNNAGK